LTATGAYHQKLPRRFELDIGGRVEAAGRATPLFELPSFGGSDTVRGFRRDDALGRKLWSLQHELWVPLPVGGSDQDAGPLRALLRQSVKLAPFVDVGGLYGAVRGRAGARAGAGLGLRLVYSPLVFKLDFGYGFGGAATDARRGKVHFGVVSNLPF
jgi:hemolysin activation/secretion protein